MRLTRTILIKYNFTQTITNQIFRDMDQVVQMIW